MIRVYKKFKGRYEIPLDYDYNGKPLLFPSVKEAMKFLYERNFDMETVKDLEFEIMGDDRDEREIENSQEIGRFMQKDFINTGLFY